MHQLLDKKSKLVNSTLERLHAEEDQVVAHVAEGGAEGVPERRVARTQKKVIIVRALVKKMLI